MTAPVLDHMTRPKLRPKGRTRHDPVRQCFVLLLPERAVLLNETAAEVLQLCDGTRTLSGLIKVLERKYADAELQADVANLACAAAAKGTIEWTHKP